MLFFGLTDTAGETWAQSEAKVISHCSAKLQINIEPRDIERAHRLGAFHPDKKRPVIVKFTHFKDKDRILGASWKIKGLEVTVSEDFSPNTRLARKKLTEFGKTQGTPYKLRHDRLKLGDATYMYDHSSKKVVRRDS